MDYLDLDFLEIGTSDFDTLSDNCADDIVGIAIEPIIEYLDKIPNRPLVKKLNIAIAANNQDTITAVHYIPPTVIAEKNLSWWVKGCNTVGNAHPSILGYDEMKDLIEKREIRQRPIADVLTEHNVRVIKYLKIDTEGSDCYILSHLISYLEGKTREFWPRRIKFESNILTPAPLILSTIERFKRHGYCVVSSNEYDTELLKNIE